jgi:serine/threonine-protein kinase RsbT
MAAMSPKTERLTLSDTEDVVKVRQAVRTCAVGLGFSLVDQTKIVTAASEIARNTVIYGGGGWAELEILNRGDRKGLQIVFEDTGPGIADIDKALQDGYTSGNGLGLGLGGAKRLVNDFEISSTPGSGTRIALRRWKP